MKFEFPGSIADVNVVPEQFRPLYEKAEGASEFTLSGDPKVRGAIEALVGLNKALAAARIDAENARKKQIDLSPLRDFGEDPAAIHTTVQSKLKELQDQLAGEGKKRLDLEAIRKEMSESQEAMKKTYEDKLGKRRAQLFDVLGKERMAVAIAKSQGNLALLSPHLEKELRVEEDENGRIEVAVVDASGSVRWSAKDPGKKMSIEERVEEMKSSTTYAPLFKSESPSGGGTPPGSGNRSPKGDGNQQKSSKEKIMAGLAKGNFTNGRPTGTRGADTPTGG